MWGYEVYEMMKRLFLVAILPLLGEGVMRAFLGILVSTGAAFWARESWPFVKSTKATGAHGELANFGRVLRVGRTHHRLARELRLGRLNDGRLLLLNLACLVLVAYWCIKIEAAEMERRAWRQNLELSWTEQQLVRDIMEGRNLPDGSGGGDNGGGDGAWFDDATGTDDDKDKKKTPQLEMTRLKEGGGVEDEASEARRRAEREQEVLEQVLLPPKNVQLMEKIGAGAFAQ